MSLTLKKQKIIWLIFFQITVVGHISYLALSLWLKCFQGHLGINWLDGFGFVSKSNFSDCCCFSKFCPLQWISSKSILIAQGEPSNCSFLKAMQVHSKINTQPSPKAFYIHCCVIKRKKLSEYLERFGLQD